MRRISLVASVLALIALSVSAISYGGSTASAADDPEAALQTFVDAVNAGDGAAMAASFTDDGYFQDIDGGAFGIFGMAAVQVAFNEIESDDIHVTVTDSSVSGSTITGTVEVSDVDSVAAGIDRYIQSFVATASGDKLASFVLRYDEDDAQTATYLAYEPEDDGDDEDPDDFIQLDMSGNQAGQAGAGTAGDGAIFAFIEIASGPEGVEQPAAIRSGTCAALGDITQWLAPVVGGNNGNLLSMTMDDLLGSPHAFTVSDSPDSSNVIVSCANIVKSASTGGPGLPGTGMGGSNGFDLSWLIATLALVGVAFAGAGTLAARRRL